MAIDSYEHYLNNNKSVFAETSEAGMKFAYSAKKLLEMIMYPESVADFEINKIQVENKNSLFGIWFSEKIKGINKN